MARKCEWKGCEKQAVRSVSFDYDTVFSYCEEHARIVEQELERQEREMRERKERQEKAKEEARKLLAFKLNEVPFIVKEYEGRPDSYVTLGKKIPYEIYKELVSAKALVKEKDDEDSNVYYIIKDEQKAAQILAKHGYKAIFSKEWQQRFNKACEILKQAGLTPSSVLFIR
jgi:hypothetical protein